MTLKQQIACGLVEGAIWAGVMLACVLIGGWLLSISGGQ